MSSWEEHVGATADALVGLLRAGPDRQLAAADLDIAVTARAAVLACVESALAELASGGRHGRAEVSIAAVERDPVRALAQLVRNRPRLELASSPSRLLEPGVPAGPAGELWRQAGRHAVLAVRVWSTMPRAGLDGPRAWLVLSEVAALAEAVGVCDRDLAAAAVASGSRDDVLRLVHDSAGLRMAAREALDLAGAQRLPEPGEATLLPASPIMGGPARVDGPAAVPEATRRLGVLLNAAEALAPRQVRSAARVMRDLAVLAAAGTIPEPDGQAQRDLRRELGELARTLHAVTTGARHEAGLLPMSALEVEEQLRELHAFTRRAFTAGGPHASQRTQLSPVLARRLAQHLPAAVEALERRTAAQIADHRWAVLDRTGRTRLRYTIASTTDPDRVPGLLRDLHRAGAAGAGLAGAAGPPALRASALAGAAGPVHPGLAEAVRAHPRPPPRLAHPGRPPIPPPPRAVPPGPGR